MESRDRLGTWADGCVRRRPHRSLRPVRSGGLETPESGFDEFSSARLCFKFKDFLDVFIMRAKETFKITAYIFLIVHVDFEQYHQIDGFPQELLSINYRGQE